MLTERVARLKDSVAHSALLSNRLEEVIRRNRRKRPVQALVEEDLEPVRAGFERATVSRQQPSLEPALEARVRSRVGIFILLTARAQIHACRPAWRQAVRSQRAARAATALGRRPDGDEIQKCALSAPLASRLCHAQALTVKRKCWTHPRCNKPYAAKIETRRKSISDHLRSSTARCVKMSAHAVLKQVSETPNANG